MNFRSHHTSIHLSLYPHGLFFVFAVLLTNQSTINNMAVTGQIKSKEKFSTSGFIMHSAQNAAKEIMPPDNSHFQARPNPIRPIPATDNCKMALFVKGFPGFSPKNVSPININNKKAIMRPLNPLRIHRNSLYGLAFIRCSIKSNLLSMNVRFKHLYPH